MAESAETGRVQEGTRKIAAQIEGIKTMKASGMVFESYPTAKLNNKKYIAGYIEGLQHALYLLGKAV